tara:strand:- start:2119 stop:2415 length:297 start_codon:yes stop_codon:yes gene_type:complete
MIKVAIERILAPGMEQTYYQVLRKAKFEASGVTGYINSEVLRNHENPNHWLLLISWESLADWSAWERSETRRRLLAEISVMLEQPESITVYEPGFVKV